jgi:hypothetical protein
MTVTANYNTSFSRCGCRGHNLCGGHLCRLRRRYLHHVPLVRVVGVLLQRLLRRHRLNTAQGLDLTAGGEELCLADGRRSGGRHLLHDLNVAQTRDVNGGTR